VDPVSLARTSLPDFAALQASNHATLAAASTDQLLALSETMGSRSLAQVVECDEKFRPVLHLLLGRTFYVGETLFEEGILRGGL